MILTRQQQQIIDAGTTIGLDRPTDQDKAFLARQLVQTTLPHADPGNVPVWSRSNGSLTLTIQQGYDDDGQPYGHPYGTIPRLLMYWMTTEALRTKILRVRLLPPRCCRSGSFSGERQVRQVAPRGCKLNPPKIPLPLWRNKPSCHQPHFFCRV